MRSDLYVWAPAGWPLEETFAEENEKIVLIFARSFCESADNRASIASAAFG